MHGRGESRPPDGDVGFDRAIDPVGVAGPAIRARPAGQVPQQFAGAAGQRQADRGQPAEGRVRADPPVRRKVRHRHHQPQINAGRVGQPADHLHDVFGDAGALAGRRVRTDVGGDAHGRPYATDCRATRNWICRPTFRKSAARKVG